MAFVDRCCRWHRKHIFPKQIKPQASSSRANKFERDGKSYCHVHILWREHNDDALIGQCGGREIERHSKRNNTAANHFCYSSIFDNS